MKGFVYFIRLNGLDPIKIGYTTDPKGLSRFESLKTYAPFGATYFAHIPTLNAPALEFELHERFKDKRLKGEWFDLKQNEIAKIVYQKGGKFGEPTIDFDEFVKNEIENVNVHPRELLPIRVQQWFAALPNSFTLEYIFHDKAQAASNEAANIGAESTQYKWVKRLRDLKLIDVDRTGVYNKI